MWEYFEQGQDGCYWTLMDYPAWKSDYEYYASAESCEDLYDYQDMLNGPSRGQPALKIYKEGN